MHEQLYFMLHWLDSILESLSWITLRVCFYFIPWSLIILYIEIAFNREQWQHMVLVSLWGPTIHHPRHTKSQQQKAEMLLVNKFEKTTTTMVVIFYWLYPSEHLLHLNRTILGELSKHQRSKWWKRLFNCKIGSVPDQLVDVSLYITILWHSFCSVYLFPSRSAAQ